ncbi:MAG: redox-sensing transcriptional repressor Rex [Erysipelotrichaceae bacterium]|jgi:redox-sensing transcriptional repressor|nr:redox-sensing transcriptional repressor Rex [Erysipelotrichaceae bacterium]MBQ1811616.1 redox-sensing transcriptional repressor Rex [Erysipelotrichaceae bacterium]MBQ2079613.1 redox-sensing transcriptional repressor Rex [Erysipelotrichaceae bacterium]MBQ2139078.1 redox-sensing transcriptional repressor Rex [Erysipelotrichaceae bacterium]MBQ2506534.1 redox-sensing transcriptional repressor Rex [Erysipelotrichaceae bacterium]
MSEISKATLKRYPVYLKALRKLSQNGVKRIRSTELSEYVDVKATTIRHDFSMIGQLGKQGYGYDIDELIRIFADALGEDYDEDMILIGVGRLGKAILNYNNWNHVAGEIVCAFDLKPEKRNQEQQVNVPVYHISQLKEKFPKGCEIAILCIPSGAQEIVNELHELGVKGIVNFTREHFVLPEGMIKSDVDVVSTIEELVFEINSLNK